MGTQWEMRLPWNKSKWFRMYNIHAIQYNIILLYTRIITILRYLHRLYVMLIFYIDFFLLPFYYYYFFIFIAFVSLQNPRILLSLPSMSYTNNYFQGDYTRLFDSWTIALRRTRASAVQAPYSSFEIQRQQPTSYPSCIILHNILYVDRSMENNMVNCADIYFSLFFFQMYLQRNRIQFNTILFLSYYNCSCTRFTQQGLINPINHNIII